MKAFSDYITIEPDRPQGGEFTVNDVYIDETGIIKDCGPKTSKELQSLKGKKVLFNAWACEQKVIKNKKYYFAPESANVVCAIL